MLGILISLEALAWAKCVLVLSIDVVVTDINGSKFVVSDTPEIGRASCRERV